MIIISVTWNLLTLNKLNIINSLEISYKYCLGQSCSRKSITFPVQLNNKMMALSFTLLFIIWLFVSLVLNRSYTSLLLNTYFNVKFKPVVESLEDIRQQKELQISGIPYYFNIIMKQFKIDIGDLISRLNENKDNFPNPIYSHKVAEQVINSRTVLIANTFHTEHFRIQNKYYHDKMVITNKYYHQIMLFYVKQLPFSNELRY